MKNLIKTTEGAIVIGGLVATVLFGKVFAIATGIAYAAINVPNFLDWIHRVTKLDINVD